MFQLLSIHSPFLCALSQKFYKKYIFQCKKMHICEKNGNFKKMLKNECESFYMFAPPVKVPVGCCDYVKFFIWVKILFLVEVLFLM